MIDYNKRAVIPLQPINRRSGLLPFDLIVYGRTASELQLIGNSVIYELAAKYPDYHCPSLFLVWDA